MVWQSIVSCYEVLPPCACLLHLPPKRTNSCTCALAQVSGTMDPREGRIVLHGWFTSPSPFFSGGQLSLAATACVVAWRWMGFEPGC